MTESKKIIIIKKLKVILLKKKKKAKNKTKLSWDQSEYLKKKKKTVF